MPPANPSYVNAPVIFPRPVTGHRRVVQLTHSGLGLYSLLTTDANWNESLTPSYNIYAKTPPFGDKQKVLHCQGTKEITWRISGELSGLTLGLMGLFSSANRGTNLTSLLIQQGLNDSDFFTNLSGFSLPWNSFSLSGNQNSLVTFSIEGKSTQPPVSSSFAVPESPVDSPIPAWFTGNDYVISWSLSHSVNLNPVWGNTVSALPLYYRPAESELTVQVTTAVALREHTLIRFGLGSVALVQAVVTGRDRVFGDRSSVVTYQTTTTNARITDNAAYQSVVNIAFGSPPNATGLSP